jgi:hypothetical protein
VVGRIYRPLCACIQPVNGTLSDRERGEHYGTWPQRDAEILVVFKASPCGTDNRLSG